MLLVLFLVFVVTPIVELAVIVQVAGSTGVMNTIGLLVLVSLVGAWLVRREGLGILRRAQAELAEGRMPGRELVDGLLVDAGRTRWTFGMRSGDGGFTTGPADGPILDVDSWEDGTDGHRRLPPNGD